ncbi:uncharacterized protein LOC134228875, partial [Saccostrea cucullata]|uniref:uncharacterized protein LOC134228875 n=1 Tax=Saccostrea cuccullata TaxID=36930 RepID=UPI002ED0E6CC
DTEFSLHNRPKECDPNYFRIGETKCEPCDPGKYGFNCSIPCPDNTYGRFCYGTCNCTPDELCDRKFGCLSNSSNFTTADSKRMIGVDTNYFPEKLTMFLLVSLASVVIFSVLCSIFLIRISKRHYKRELQRMISNVSEERSDAVHEYFGYDTMDSMSAIPRLPSANTYDHIDRGEYNILTLSQRAYAGDANTSPVTSFHRQNSKTEMNDNKRFEIDIEPECLVNLFQEENDHLLNDGIESQTISKL